MIVLTNGLEILKAEMSPIIECFWQDYYLLLFIPRFEERKTEYWGIPRVNT